MTNIILNQINQFRVSINQYRTRRWWKNLKKMGMQLGKDINLPRSVADKRLNILEVEE